MKISGYFQAIFLASTILEFGAETKSNKVQRSVLDIMAEDPPLERSVFTRGSISVQEQYLILRMHDIYRSQVNATNMMKLRYHIGISRKAQTLADSCSFKQDISANRAVAELPNVFIGQNICVGSYSWEDCISTWANEMYNFGYGIGSRNGRPVGYYTQMVLWKSMAIGCGFNSCRGNPFYVCNYAYGQYRNEQKLPYKPGAQCTDCPNSCTEQAFCGIQHTLNNYCLCSKWSY
ncbi:hypothetical protein ACJMK2_026081 [Sinanodonta woodiana]|uniref:SCP domain-containing protein n=1 Tax=Sinanodonta woodiana TaxID=1069815 RepID=A0ABD3XM11_SINWO